jgi:hypothetical protein
MKTFKNIIFTTFIAIIAVISISTDVAAMSIPTISSTTPTNVSINDNNNNNEIIIKIYPEEFMPMEHLETGLPSCKIIFVTIEGFKKDQITLIEKFEKCEPSSSIPLYVIRKFNYLAPNDHLIIKKCTSSAKGKDECKWDDIKLSQSVLDKILKYLLHDRNDEKFCCAYFFAEVLYGTFFVKLFYDTFNTTIFSSKIHINKSSDEKYLKVGDGVMLTDKITFGGGNPSKHFAIYLGDDLFISQAGNHGAIVVMAMKEMLKFWGGDHFFKMSLRGFQLGIDNQPSTLYFDLN